MSEKDEPKASDGEIFEYIMRMTKEKYAPAVQLVRDYRLDHDKTAIKEGKLGCDCTFCIRADQVLKRIDKAGG